MTAVERTWRRVEFSRNRSCLLFGVSWSHHSSWPFRTTHFYLGLWVFTARRAAVVKTETR